MTRFVFLILLIGFWFVSPVWGQDGNDGVSNQPDRVTLRFVATVPDDTPESASVYLSGNLPQLGNWNGRGLKLARQETGSYAGSLLVKRGTSVEFKTTLGSWATVEKSAEGFEIENRRVVADADQQVDVVVAAWASVITTQTQPTLTGNIHTHDNFPSEILGNERTLIVYLPPGYDDETDRFYPVLYMHDGQNIFDAATSFAGVEWQVDEAAERLIKADQIEPIIIVGIYNNADRMDEYNPGDPDAQVTDYARFVVEEVRPFIEKTYRADHDRDRTGVAGSSMGGLISLYLAQVYPEVFNRCGIISPALGFERRRYLDALLVEDPQWMKGARFWLDMGTAEAEGSTGNLLLRHTRDLAGHFKAADPALGMTYEYLEVEDGRHNEGAWSQRVETILTFLYGR